MTQNNKGGTDIQYRLDNDLMFSLVMQDKELCKGLIERILPGRKVRNLRICNTESPEEFEREVAGMAETDAEKAEKTGETAEGEAETQKTIITGILSKSVRLDVLFADDENWFELEMQTAEDTHLPLRGRYYGSAMDIDQIGRGAHYHHLKNSYVIFICRFDHYGLDQGVYSFQNYDCKNHLPYGDNSFKIVVNTKSSKENTPPELIPFFDYLNDMEVLEGDEFIAALHRQVEKYNTSDWRRRLMTLEEKMRLERDRAFAEGEAKGRAEGEAEGEARARLANAAKMKEEGIEAVVIGKITGLSMEEIEKL